MGVRSVWQISEIDMDASFWNDRYSADQYFYGDAPNDFVAQCAEQIPLGPVLCLAEGECRNAVHLAMLGRRVTAVDQSGVGLAKGRQLAAARGVNVETVVANLDNFSIARDSWAAIVAIFAHLPPPLRRRIHREVVSGLRPGGVFVLEAYTPAQLAFDTGGPKSPELLMSLECLRQELAGLDFLIARELERDVKEGNGHTGRSAVVQIMARRR